MKKMAKKKPYSEMRGVNRGIDASNPIGKQKNEMQTEKKIKGRKDRIGGAFVRSERKVLGGGEADLSSFAYNLN